MSDAALKKRDRTRDRLLFAAQELVLERGLPAITINDIAARADVAPGTFYNYFHTREEVADTIADLLMRAYHRDVDAAVAGIDEPARVFAASLRQTLHWVSAGNALGKLMFGSGVPLMRYAFGIRQRAGQDIRTGIDANVFRVDDVVAIQSMLGGIVLSALLDLWLGQLQPASIRHITERSLGLLGVPAAKARRIAAEELTLRAAPVMPLSASELLEPVEGRALPGISLPVGTLMFTMPAAKVGAVAAGKRPRVSRGLRGNAKV